VEEIESFSEFDAVQGSFDCVRLTPLFAQDDNRGETGKQKSLSIPLRLLIR
jgi:hypothetical protein